MHREKQVIQNTRYHITHVTRQADTIAALRQRLGWKVFVTNAGPKRVSLQEAVLCYRNEYRVERIVNRLKSRVISRRCLSNSTTKSRASRTC